MKHFLFLLAGAALAVAQAADPYSVALWGPRQVAPGSDIFIQATLTYNNGIPVYPTGYIYGTFDAPAGITGEIECPRHIGCWTGPAGRFVWNQTANPDIFALHLSVPASTAPGKYTVTFLPKVATVVIPVPVEISVVAPKSPAALALPPLDTAKWLATAQTLGKKWCQPGKVYGFGWEGDAWYYDGGRVYFQLADFTGDKSWESCAYTILDQYRDYILANKGIGAGWRVFSKGLRMGYERTGDDRYRQAVVFLATGSPYAKFGGALTNDLIRETAYIIDAYVDAELVGQPRSPYLSRAVDYLLGQIEVLTRGDHSYVLPHQSFYDALATEALINYYELTKDPRVPPAIKSILDWLRCNVQAHGFVYDPDVATPKWPTEINNLILPAFGWYYQLTGDVTYQIAGDDAFAHALDTDISYSGKIFSQNYRWSGDYIKWRTTVR